MKKHIARAYTIGRKLFHLLPNFLVAGAIVVAVMPGSFWLTVDSVQVLDSKAGKQPIMLVIRTVHIPSPASMMKWHIDVRRVDAPTVNGGYKSDCDAAGNGINDPPPRPPLDWWTWPVTCKLNPGLYIVETEWDVGIWPFQKAVKNISNVFTISE